MTVLRGEIFLNYFETKLFLPQTPRLRWIPLRPDQRKRRSLGTPSTCPETTALWPTIGKYFIIFHNSHLLHFTTFCIFSINNIPKSYIYPPTQRIFVQVIVVVRHWEGLGSLLTGLTGLTVLLDLMIFRLMKYLTAVQFPGTATATTLHLKILSASIINRCSCCIFSTKIDFRSRPAGASNNKIKELQLSHSTPMI